MKLYLKPAILTIFIFLIGVMIGITIDNYRLSSARKSISESEIRWNDAQLLNLHLERLGSDYCNLALEENLAYNDKIYDYGSNIEKTIDATRFTPEIEQEWRRYVLLQTQFWFNSIDLKEKCGFDYYNIVHISRKKNSTTQEEINNKIQSTILLDLKEKCGNKIMLIPLTADVNLIVIDSIIKQFNITSFPAIVINEKYVFQGLTTMEELNKYIEC
jgi:hypothetical protein